MVKPIPIHIAKTNLSWLIVRACTGEEIIISRWEEPVVRLIPIEPVHGRRIPGSMKGQFTTDAGFDAPLSEAELSAWEGVLWLSFCVDELANNFDARIRREGFLPLDISVAHAQRAGLLSGEHRDPFDRMLMAQALALDVPIVSNELL